MTGDNQDVLEFLNQTKAMYDEDSTNYMICKQAIAAVMGVQKAAMKLAYIHRCIDLYCDREELHDESYWLDYILDPEWIDTDIGWTGDKMTPNQSETPTRCDHLREATKKVDLIDRQAAIDVVNAWFQAYANRSMSKVMSIQDVLRNLPSAQPERLTDDDFETIRIHLSAYKEKLCNQQRWKEAEEYQRIIDRFMAFASAQPCYKTDHGYMWLCPECGLAVHSDYDRCVRCGHERREQ